MLENQEKLFSRGKPVMQEKHARCGVYTRRNRCIKWPSIDATLNIFRDNMRDENGNMQENEKMTSSSTLVRVPAVGCVKY